jgi:hypothetical protein
VKRKYRVVLPIDTTVTDEKGNVVEGPAYGYGDVVELTAETAKLYAHALIAEDDSEAAILAQNAHAARHAAEEASNKAAAEDLARAEAEKAGEEK